MESCCGHGDPQKLQKANCQEGENRDSLSPGRGAFPGTDPRIPWGMAIATLLGDWYDFVWWTARLEMYF